jgi:ABC-type nitrate/sulfonate/bicarbonate transport system substrate-binding protein
MTDVSLSVIFGEAKNSVWERGFLMHIEKTHRENSILKHNKWLAPLSFVLCLALLATGALSCKSAPMTKTTIKMVMATPFNTWMATYAIRQGLITSDKVDVQIALATDYDTQMMAGNFPMGTMSTANFAIATQNKNLPLRALSSYIVQSGSQEAQGVYYIVTLAGSKIASPQDLVGKKVGVPDLTSSGTSAFLALFKKDYGISASQFTLVNNSNTLLMQLLKSGDIDAALLGQNNGVQAALDPTYKVIWNMDKTFIQEYGSPFVASLLVVNGDFLSQNAAAVKAAYDLLVESNQYGEQHIDELAPIYATQYGQTADFYHLVFTEHSKVSLNLIEGKTQDTLITIFGFVKDNGVISSLPDPKVVFKNP